MPPPIAPDPLEFFMTQSRLAMETLYEGHVRLTNNLLPLMPQTGYSRILFTTSVVAYNVGGTELGESQGQSFLSAYYSGKRALLAYANNLRGFLRTSGSSTQVSTLNPVVINTGLALGTNPIVTEPVDADGNSPFNPVLQSVIDGFRLALQAVCPRSSRQRPIRRFSPGVHRPRTLPSVHGVSPSPPWASTARSLIRCRERMMNLRCAFVVAESVRWTRAPQTGVERFARPADLFLAWITGLSDPRADIRSSFPDR